MQPFDDSDDGSGSFVAGLSTPERLVLAQVTGDVVELLGGEDGFFGLDDAPELDADDLLRQLAENDERTQDGPASSDDDSRIREILDGMDDQIVLPPTDPAVRRLLPDASDDAEVAQEFRRFTDDDLRQRKVDRLLLLAELLLDAPPSRDEDEQLPFLVMVDEGEAVAGALGDIRQVIGARLDLNTDQDTEDLYDAVSSTWEPEQDERAGSEDADQPDLPREPHAGEAMSGPRLFLGSVFLLAGFLQESLTECLLHRHRSSRPDG